MPFSQLKSFLALSEDERKNLKQPGVPLDSTNKQLIDWVQGSLRINDQYKLAIKGDNTTTFPNVKNLFEGLRDIEFYQFWLITNQEAGPK